MDIQLIRVATNSTQTQGVIVWGNVAQYLTLELPWKGNAVGLSCIPHGTYNGVYHVSPKFGGTYLLDVPGRSEIILHEGNLPEDTQGCILVGSKFGKIKGQPAILNSKFAIEDLIRRLTYLGAKSIRLQVMGV